MSQALLSTSARLALLILSYVSFSAVAASIDEFTQDMQAHTGFVDFYHHEKTGKIYLKLNAFDQPLLFQSSLPQGIGSNDIGLDRGQLGETRLVEFERFGDKVLLKQLNTQYRASSANVAEQQSIDEAFADSVIAGLPIVAEQGRQVLVDYTDFLLSDIHQISQRLSDTKQGSYQLDPGRSGVFAPRSKAFVDNTELEALVTFGGSKPGEYVRQVTPSARSITVHLHHSLIRLPDDQYQARQFVPYSGFWQISYQDYSAPLDKSMTQRVIPRHRLAKKDPQAKISEAQEPIIYYLDPGIPEPVMSALKEGASWWDQAFVDIGYKNAFQVKVLPADVDPMDVRYNVIQWVHRATRGWSYGSSVIDPRSGEIIKGHVTLGSLRVRQDYLIALGLTSPFANGNQQTQQQQEMSLARIRQLSAHEVGHTLGLAHNFAASADGRASVMDYPHPLIDIKHNKIDLSDAYDKGIGVWDKHSIAYGYQHIASNQTEASYLDEVIQRARAKGLHYQSDPDARPAHAANARGHLWDNGATALEGLDNILAVRKLALSRFGMDTLAANDGLSSLEEKLVPIYYLHRFQLAAVAKLIGGVEYEYERKGDYPNPKGVVRVKPDTQKQAIDALLATLHHDFLSLSPALQKLITPKIYGDQRNRESFKGRTGVTFDPISAAEASAGYSMQLLLQPQRLNRLNQHRANNLDIEYLVSQLLKRTIQDHGNDKVSDVDKRIDFVVLESVMGAMANPQLAPEVRASLYTQMTNLHTWLKDKSDAQHHRLMAKHIAWFEHSGQWQPLLDIKPLPPGSPI